MALFADVVGAFIASRELDPASRSRLAYWTEALGEKDLGAITPDEVDAPLMKLAERGRLKGGKGGTTVTGTPLAGATLNRYQSQLGSVYKYAKRVKLLPRAFVPPARVIERAPERPDPERYLRAEEVERLIAVTRVMDRHWGKMCALILTAYHTGLRVGSILRARG